MTDGKRGSDKEHLPLPYSLTHKKLGGNKWLL